MLRQLLKLIVFAGIIDALLFLVTRPLIDFLLPFFLPQTLVSSPDVIWTYGLVIFSVLLGIILLLLWVFEGVYANTFSFWDVIIIMSIIFLLVYFRENIMSFIVKWIPVSP